MTPEAATIEPTTALTGQPSWTPLDIPAVKTPEDEQNVVDYMNLAKSFQTRVKDFFKPHKDRAFAAHRGLCNAENDVIKPAIETELACKNALVLYRRQVEEEARKERERLEALARQEEEARRVNEAAALERAALANPDRAEAQEQFQEAETLINTPIDTTVVFVPPPPKATGGAYKDKWDATLTDKAKLLIAVAAQCAARPELLALFEYSPSAGRKLADMTKADKKEILPGLVCVRDINVSGRRR